MSATSLTYYQGQVLKVNPRVLRLEYVVNGAKDVSSKVPQSFVLHTFDALSTQAQIDDHLGTSSEFLLAQFDATAMGVDAFAGIVDMQGQAVTAFSVDAKLYDAAGALVGTQQCKSSSAALSSSTLETSYAVGADGNLAFRVVYTGLDAATDGMLAVELRWAA